MSTGTLPDADPTAHHAGPVEPEDRGATTIAQRTVERLAMHAIGELPDVGGAARRMFGVAIAGEDLDNAAQVSATILGDRASLDVRISVVYPASVGATTEAVRAHLMRRVEEFTGITVRRVNITVTALHSRLTSRVGRVQ
ncbi:MAG TPA: Asp23/Gls24 family envelope stress response protein [Pseudonocardiaceae bacterium]|jgi:uncharacterized alkaline shock family protein YloU|nr:Asp23/Gls24 family envelope stress response protein [Pseudonocardiaceae bacterium]